MPALVDSENTTYLVDATKKVQNCPEKEARYKAFLQNFQIFRKEPFFHGHDNYDQVIQVGSCGRMCALIDHIIDLFLKLRSSSCELLKSLVQKNFMITLKSIALNWTRDLTTYWEGVWVHFDVEIIATLFVT